MSDETLLTFYEHCQLHMNDTACPANIIKMRRGKVDFDQQKPFPMRA